MTDTDAEQLRQMADGWVPSWRHDVFHTSEDGHLPDRAGCQLCAADPDEQRAALFRRAADALDRAPRPINPDDPEPPVGSIVTDMDGDAWQRHAGGWSCSCPLPGEPQPWDWDQVRPWASLGGVLLRDGAE